MTEPSRLAISLDCENADLDKKIKVANAAHRLISDDSVKFIFQEMQENLFKAFSSVQTPEVGESVWREVKVINALKDNLEWYANQRESLTKRAGK